VAALALAVKGILGVQEVRFWSKLVAGLALLHRLAFPPEVATPFIVVVTLFTGDPGLGVALMAEFNRRFFMPRFLNVQPALVRRRDGAHRPPGSQAPEKRQGNEPTA
jgi:hypothetical protein